MNAAIKRRVDDIEAQIRPRWERAWDNFFESVWAPFSDDDLEAFVSACAELHAADDLSGADAIAKGWRSACGCGEDTGPCPWLDNASDVMEAHAAGDLSVWPCALADPPEEEPEAWGILTAAIHSEDVNERIAGVCTLEAYALARAARKLPKL